MQEELSFPSRVMLNAARDRADAGIERAAQATEDRDTGWCEMACERLREFVVAQPHGTMFTIEIARASFEKKISRPRDLRTWGKVTRMAMARGYIEKVPGRSFAAVSSNGSLKPVYRRGGKA